MNRVVRQDSRDSLSFQLMIDYQVPTVTAQEVEILSRTGGSIRAKSAAGVTESGGLITDDPNTVTPTPESWAEATYAVGVGYIARFYATVGGFESSYDVFFAVAPRGFTSELTDADCTREAPSIAAQIDPTNGLRYIRKAAWEEILGEVATATWPHPFWRVLDPSVLQRAHLYGTLWRWYKQHAKNTGPGSEAWDKALAYEDDYRRSLERALQRLTVDTDEDNYADTSEVETNWQVNWTP